MVVPQLGRQPKVDLSVRRVKQRRVIEVEPSRSMDVCGARQSQCVSKTSPRPGILLLDRIAALVSQHKRRHLPLLYSSLEVPEFLFITPL